MGGTGHIDTFARDRLPPPHAMPDVLLDQAGLQFPDDLNAAVALLDRHVEAGRGDRRCIVAADGTVWSYDDVRTLSNRIARVLVEDYGIVPGNRVLLRAPNCPMLAASWLGVLKAGAIAVSTMPLYRATELGVIVHKAQVDLALCDARIRDELDLALERTHELAVIPFNGDGPRDLEQLALRKTPDFEPVHTAADDVALIAFTSGTTGAPKAAMHFHRDLLATCETYGERVLRPQPGDLFAGSPPLAFTFGLGGLLLFPLHAGAATLLLEKAGPEQLLDATQRFGLTTIFTAPVAYRRMTEMAQRYDLRTLRTCVSAGETLPRSVWQGWYEKTGLTILDGIGSTEMLHIFIGSPQDEVRAGSTGRPVPGYVAQIQDEDGRPVPPGETGRLAVKGPTGCKYLDDERQSVYVQNGWNYPGDTYRCDEDGYFWYVARSDDMIVSAGYNISGPEVEQALMGHPAVREVAVVGKPDPSRQTNVVKAFVVLADGFLPEDPLVTELQTYCQSTIAPFKSPREIEFVDELPRTQTGKVQRYRLRERAAEEPS